MTAYVATAVLSVLLTGTPPSVQEIMDRIRAFSFAPIDDERTQDPVLRDDGIADLGDETWRIHLLAIRDLARLGPHAAADIGPFLKDDNAHVRNVAALVLGLYPSSENEVFLIELLRADTDPVVRSQVVISLAQIKSKKAVPLLGEMAKNDPSRDVRHQCDLAIHRITKYEGPEVDLAAAYATLDESKFEQIRVGQPAIDFELADTEGNSWRLSDFKGKKDVVLIWIFADWCPVCHNEFRELIHLKEEYAAQNVEVVTIECHDPYRARVMIGREFQPTYWFSKTSPQGFYDGKIWWRHLADPAGSVGAMYGVQPMEFVVHSEWINRPTTVIVDKDGVVRFAYYGTYWGDRPSIGKTLEMIKTRQFDFEHPKRLKPDQAAKVP